MLTSWPTLPMQIIVPSNGCRIIIATDGLWDVLNFKKVVTAARVYAAPSAASALITLVSREHRVIDDTSIIVLDMLPSSSTTFPDMVRAQNAGMDVTPRKKPSVGLFACFRPEVGVPDSRDVTGHGHLPLYAQVDGLKVTIRLVTSDTVSNTVPVLAEDKIH